MVKPNLQPPVDKPWIGLIDALTWIAFDHSFSLKELLSPSRPVQGTLSEIHPRLQEAWEQLADTASLGGIALRGKRRCERHNIKEREERDLVTDDLRNCRYLSWPKDLGGARKPRVEWFRDGSVIEEVWPTFVRLRSNDEVLQDFFSSDSSVDASDDWAEDFARATEHDGFDYVDVVVSRGGLMKAWPVRGKQRAASLAIEDKAAQWLDQALAERPAATNLKADLISELGRLGLSRSQQDRVWKGVASKHVDWHGKRGRPKKGSEIKLEEKF